MLKIPSDLIIKYDGSFLDSSLFDKTLEEVRRIKLDLGYDLFLPLDSYVLTFSGGLIHKTQVRDISLEDWLLIPHLNIHEKKTIKNEEFSMYLRSDTKDFSSCCIADVLNNFSLSSKKDIEYFLRTRSGELFTRNSLMFLKGLQLLCREKLEINLRIRKRDNGCSFIVSNKPIVLDKNKNTFAEVLGIEKVSKRKSVVLIDDKIAHTIAGIIY